MPRIATGLLLVIVAAAPNFATASDRTEVDRIIAEMDRRMSSADDQLFRHEMITRSKGADERRSEFTVHIKGDTRRRLEFLAPGDVRGMRVLTKHSSLPIMPAPEKGATVSTHEGMDNLWLPFTQMGDPLGPTPHIVRGEGCVLIDEDGKRYLDGIASWWVNLHGHNHPRLIAALQRQAEVLPHCSLGSMTHDPALAVAAGLARLAPEGLTRVFFSDDGSTAVETALKISLQFFQQNGQAKRTRFAALTRAYHGDTLGAVSVGGIESYHGKFRPLCFEALFAEAPDCARCDEGGDTVQALPGGPEPDCSLKCLASLEGILEQHGDTLCGLIVEPLVQGAVGMRMYRAAALRRMRELCTTHGVHLIADCVAVAFGRTGAMFACEHAGITPDLLAVAKGLTGGYVPLAATLASESIYEGFTGSYASDRKLAHGHSFTGNPLAAACAAENLALLEDEQVIEGLGPKIEQLRALWAGLAELPHVAELRQTGLITALNLYEDAEKKTPYPADAQVARRVALDCIERGLFLRPLGDALYLLPPLAISEEELELAVGTLRESILAVTGEASIAHSALDFK